MSSIARTIKQINDGQGKLKASDKNKNRIFKEYEDGTKEWIHAGKGSGETPVVSSIKIPVLTSDPEVLEDGMIWIRKDLL